MRKPTKDEREYLGKVASLGCVVCGDEAQVHHRTGAGMGLRASHYKTIPLCHRHHQGTEGIHQIGVKTWEERYDTQDHFIQLVQQALGHD